MSSCTHRFPLLSTIGRFRCENKRLCTPPGASRPEARDRRRFCTVRGCDSSRPGLAIPTRRSWRRREEPRACVPWGGIAALGTSVAVSRNGKVSGRDGGCPIWRNDVAAAQPVFTMYHPAGVIDRRKRCRKSLANHSRSRAPRHRTGRSLNCAGSRGCLKPNGKTADDRRRFPWGPSKITTRCR